jgi:hypothetical protein
MVAFLLFKKCGIILQDDRYDGLPHKFGSVNYLMLSAVLINYALFPVVEPNAMSVNPLEVDILLFLSLQRNSTWSIKRHC